MEGDNDQAARRLEHALGGGEAVGQFGKLVVDENAQRLKGARRRMDHAVTRVHDARDDLGQRAGRIDGLLASRLDDGARHRAGVALFAERRDDDGEIAFARARDHVGGARTVSPHAHVERAVEPEGKSARGFVELHGRNAEIEHDAVDRAHAPAIDCKFEKRSSTSSSRPCASLDQRGAVRDRALVAIDADHARARRFQDRARITAGAECGVDVKAAVAHREPVDGAAGEHGNVTGQVRQRQRCCRCRHHSRAPSGFAAAGPDAQFLLECADLLGGLREFRAKAAGLPDSEICGRDRRRSPRR